MKSKKPYVLVLCGDGINCENETAMAFREAGGDVKITHVNELIRNPSTLQNYDVMAIPGGFSFGDELGSGKLLALKLKMALSEELDKFIYNKKPIIGICNGFQVLVKMGILPFKNQKREISLTVNESGEFINEWVDLEIPIDTCCVWLESLKGKNIKLPIRHGEGRVVLGESEAGLSKLLSKGLVALRYKSNVNGSSGKIAGLCDESGLIFGLMPHPEAAIFKTTNPFLNQQHALEHDLGQHVFKNIIRYINTKNNFNDEEIS